MIKHEYPPNIDAILEAFPDAKVTNVLFAYAPDIYAPRTETIHPTLLVHENTHLKQQGDDPAGWWARYLVDEKFRLEQEFEAHHAEYVAAIMWSNRQQRRAHLTFIAKKLASRLYGNMISLKLAKKALERGYLYEPVQGDPQAVS